MILYKTSDFICTGVCSQSKLRVFFTDVRDAARELAQNHLMGPTAELVLAEALAGVTLLGAELQSSDEAVLLRMQVDGPVKGFLVEMTGTGNLRGYTNIKVINEFDEREEGDLDEVFGEHGETQITHAATGRIISQAAFVTVPASVRGAVDEYYEKSLQREAMAQIAVSGHGQFIDVARGVLVERLPDGDVDVFAKVAQLIDDGTAFQALDSAISPLAWCEAMGLPAVEFEPSRPLSFRCDCSIAKVEAVVAALPAAELGDMLEREKPAEVYCHMCGKGYEVPLTRLRELLNVKKRGN